MASHFPSLSGPYIGDTYSHIFREDAHLGVMPYIFSSGRDKRTINCSFVGEEKDVETAIDLVADFSEHERSDQTELICGAINHIAQNLSWDGKIYYEIFDT